MSWSSQMSSEPRAFSAALYSFQWSFDTFVWPVRSSCQFTRTSRQATLAGICATKPLQVEKVETHTPASLDARNQEFYTLAGRNGISYNGMDVGPVQAQEAK
jgi:hypothetical protein